MHDLVLLFILENTNIGPNHVCIRPVKFRTVYLGRQTLKSDIWYGVDIMQRDDVRSSSRQGDRLVSSILCRVTL